MSNNNKWEALSLRDRAFLIREAVRNGITDINSIRDTWEHRFDGESNQPTEDPGILDTIKGWFEEQESIEQKPTTEGYVDLNEIKRRQAWAESRFNSKAKSKAGAKGTFQIMDAVKTDYVKAGGEDGDLYDPVYNEKVRDWLFTNLGTRQWVTKGNPSDSVKIGKQLAAYNAGPGPILKGLNKAKTQGIDIYNSFDWVNTDYIPKETVDYVNWILRNKSTGVHRNDSIYNFNKHKYSGEDPVEIPAITVMPKIKRRLSDAYYHLFRTPKDYCRERTDIDNCAEWSNKQLQKSGKSIFGHAWTRSANKNLDKVISGYDVKSKPSTYDVDKVRNYLFEAADKVKSDINIKDLQDGDIVGMFFRGSPSQEQAWREGVKGEVHTHTGHIELNKRGKPFVVHNVHKDIRKNKVKKVLGSNRPYGITSIYRPK